MQLELAPAALHVALIVKRLHAGAAGRVLDLSAQQCHAVVVVGLHNMIKSIVALLADATHVIQAPVIGLHRMNCGSLLHVPGCAPLKREKTLVSMLGSVKCCRLGKLMAAASHGA